MSSKFALKEGKMLEIKEDSFQVDLETFFYKSIGLVALNRAESSVYLQIDAPNDEFAELELKPENELLLDEIFESLKKRQAESAVNEIQPESEWITAENVEGFMPSKEQMDILANLDRTIVNENGKRIAEGQFDDYEEQHQR